MSAPKLISPLLDGFVMGPPISNHHGVRCCPAMKHNSDNKYIVKIVSVPASQSQLDALLLTGAYNDPGEAMDYFKLKLDYKNYSKAYKLYRKEWIEDHIAIMIATTDKIIVVMVHHSLNPQYS